MVKVFCEQQGLEMKLSYYLLDVFTDKPLAGNQLAVVMKADLLSEKQMQAIAKEFNLSETIFVRQPRLDNHAAHVRIFTPDTELPFAGHPTVGAAVLLGLHQRLQAVRLEEEVGSITSVMERINSYTGSAHFSLPKLPEKIAADLSAEVLANALGLASDEIGCADFEPAIYSAGVPFYLVPVRDTDVLARVKIERRGWAGVFPVSKHMVYAFTEAPDEHVDFAARMFAPLAGISEDPATGAAAAALIGLLAEHVGSDDGQFKYQLRQGKELGRPSVIDINFTKAGGQLKRGGIGGKAVVVAEGTLDLSIWSDSL